MKLSLGQPRLAGAVNRCEELLPREQVERAAAGFIALFGVAVLNGLVLVTFAQRLQADGADHVVAIAQAAELRLRPVLMNMARARASLPWRTGGAPRFAYARVMRVRLVAPVLLVLLGCTEHDRRCAHARDVMLTLWEPSLKEALPGQDEAGLRRMLARAGDRFMAQCRSLSPDSQACIDRIDELGTIEHERRAAVERCPRQADGRPEPACVGAARAWADQRIADCQLALGAMFTTVLEP